MWIQKTSQNVKLLTFVDEYWQTRLVETSNKVSRLTVDFLVPRRLLAHGDNAHSSVEKCHHALLASLHKTVDQQHQLLLAAYGI